MSIVTEMKVATLEGIVNALQARVLVLENARNPTSAPRRRTASERLADGAKLRASIEGITAAHPEYSAKHVLKALAIADLGRETPPSVRAVQWHLKALRNT